MSIEKKIRTVLILLGIMSVLFAGWVFGKDSGNRQLAFDNTSELEMAQTQEEGIKILRVTLPEEFHIPMSVLYKTTHTVTEVWLDQEEIYQYGKDGQRLSFMKSPGTYWHIVDIPADSAGKTLEIRIYPVYSGYYGNSTSVAAGTRGDCILKILTESLGVLIISCGILLAGLICVILHFAEHKASGNKESGRFLNLGLFSILVAVWSLQQSGFLQFLVPDGRTLYYVDFFSFYLFPVPFNLLVYDICQSKYRKIVLYAPVLYFLNLATALALQCTGIIDIFRLLPVTHVLLLVNMAYVIWLVHYEVARNKNNVAAQFRYPLYIVLAFGLMELLLYYIREFSTTSFFLPAGTMVFIIMLIWIQIKKYYTERIQRQKVEYLQKIANMDMLTEALNRNAYEDTVRYLEEQNVELKNTGVVLLDLDDLKMVNDNFGHEKGDEALKLCYQCIRQAFQSEKNCFRIGGDEFVYIYHEEEKALIPKEIKKLEKLLEEAAASLPYSLTISAGYAYYSADMDMDFKDIVRRSDTMMYRQKRRRKLARNGKSDSAVVYGESHRSEQITDECIFKEKKYQQITTEEMCGIIDLLGPSMNNYLYVLDFRTDFYYISASATERFCIEENAFYGALEQHRKFVDPQDYPILLAEIKEIRETDRCVHNMEYRWLDLNRKPVWINCRGYVVRDDKGNPLYMTGCINEIGNRQKADNVSGLLGETSLKEYLEKGKKSLGRGYLLRLGIDHFREINEKFGWEYGDLVLKDVAACISGCMGENQRVYKLVSDEFMIVDYASGSLNEVNNLFERIQKAIDSYIESNKFTLIFTVSAGILPLNEEREENYPEVVKLTVFSLNEAKKRGRNRSYVFEEADYQRFLRRREVARELREAVEEGFKGFEAFYQPLFKSEDNSLYGAETLMRFSSEKLGMVSPKEFIPILEESCLIIPVGRWILQEALKRCVAIRKRVPCFQISVNISHVQVTKSNVLADIIGALEKTGLPSEALIIELTESGQLEENTNEGRFLAALKKLGIKLALDDFGTGYSNFHYLSELKPAIIKIDRTFTASAVADEGEYYLLSQFCSMIHNLGLKLCTEGVENEAEWRKIQNLRPDYSQGFFWGKPCTYEEFVERFVEK